jgi:hypothetical protein
VAPAEGAVEALEAAVAAASTVVRHPPERGRVLPGPDRASATETSETLETFTGITIGFTIATVMMMTFSSSEVRSFSVLRSIRTDTGTILTGTPTAIHLTDIIHMAMGTALTINPVMLRVRRADVPRWWKSSVV